MTPRRVSLLVALVLIASFAALCQARSLDSENKSNSALDTRPKLMAKVRGRILRVPLYEDVVHTEEKNSQTRAHIREMAALIKDLMRRIIIENRGYINIAYKVITVVPTFRRCMSEADELRRTDTSPRKRESWYVESSNIIKEILSKQTELTLSSKDAYERLEILVDGLEAMTASSPCGTYVDWNLMTISGHSLPDYLAPVIKNMRDNGYDLVLKAFDMIGDSLV